MKTRMIIAGIVACAAMAHAALIDSGVDSVSTANSAGFNNVAEQAVAFGAWAAAYSADVEIGITGSMTLTGTGDNLANDRVGIVFGSANSQVLDTDGSPNSTRYVLLANTSVAWPGSNEKLTTAQVGVKTVDDLLVEGTPAGGNSLNFAVNLKFPTNYDDDIDGLGHIYEYTFGFDYDKDGIYEFIESGTLDVYEDDRLRFGFLAQKSPTATEEIFTNDYAYEVYDSYVSIIPEPATLGMVGLVGLGALAIRRFIAID